MGGVKKAVKAAKATATSTVTAAAKKVVNFDGWANVLTGLGVKNRDKLMHSEANWNRLTEQELEELYASDETATKIVNMPVDEAFRAGYKITGLDAEVSEKIQDRIRELEVNESLAEAWRKGRLYGGAGVLLITDDFANMDLKISKFAKLRALNVLSRWELTINQEQIESNIMMADYGNPKQYTFNSRVAVAPTNAGYSTIIDASRLVRFDGVWLPDRLRITNNYWHDSVLTKVYDPLRNYNVSHDSIAATIQDFSVAVFKLKNLAELLGTDGDDAVIQRLQIVNMTKSIAKAVVIDADGEDFEHRTRSVSGMREIVDKIEQRLVAATPMPHTVLFGNSPTGGLGSDGAHEQNNWYDYVATLQTNYLKPKLKVIIDMIAMEMGQETRALDIEFNPLYQLDEKEEAEVRRTQAETDRIYIESGVVDPIEVAISRFGGDKYSIETTIDRGLREAIKPEPIPTLEDIPKPEETAEGAAKHPQAM